MSAMKANVLLLMAAAIWGLAFVAQRVGMDYVGPFTFNGFRFALGAASLLPLIWYYRNKDQQQTAKAGSVSAVKAGFLVGLILFSGASLQQIGLVYTTAGKAAFITCLYIVIVPILGVFLRHYISLTNWVSSGIAVVGLYLLCVKENFYISYGDLLQLAGALFWSVHILLIDYFAARVKNVLHLTFFQAATCSALSLLTASWLETITLTGLIECIIPLLYGGIGSVAIAYTLQAIGQKYSQPSHAAIIMSMETVFAAVGGFLVLGERLSFQELMGCLLMFAGMLLTQVKGVQSTPAVENIDKAGDKASCER